MRLRLSDRIAYRVSAVGLLLSVAMLLFLRVLWVGPQRDLLAIRRLELEQRRAEVADARRSAGRLSRLEGEVAGMQRRVDVLRRTVPESHEAAAVLRGLQQTAGRSGLTMEAFIVDAPRVRERYVEWPVRLELTGGFHDLTTFLDRVSRLPLMVTVGELSIRALASGPPASTISVTCRAVTYVLRESAATDDSAAAAEGDDR